MKTLFVVVSLALATMPASVSFAQTNPGQGVGPLLDFCRNVILPNDPAANLGECVSYGNAFFTPEQAAAFATHECHFQRETNPFFEEEFGSYAECIALLSGH